MGAACVVIMAGTEVEEADVAQEVGIGKADARREDVGMMGCMC